MARDYRFVAGDRVFFVVRRHVKEMMRSYEGRGNPSLWYSWEELDDERDYLACGVRTMREAQKPIDKICGITG